MSDLNRLIDNGQAVVVFRNQLASITAYALPNDNLDLHNAMQDADASGHLTDDFTVESAMKRLADKLMRVGDYSEGNT